MVTAPVDSKPAARRLDEGALRALTGEILNRRPAVGFALGIVRAGRMELFHSHGLADIASATPITEDTIFRIASISKTFTAIAVLQLWEQGLVDLDAPASEYLRGFRLVPAKADHRPATLRHLLTHTAGVPEVVNPARLLGYGFVEGFRLDERLPTPAEYYRGALHLVDEPGTRFGYTDHAVATAGQIVADVSGLPLAEYFRKRIFGPLGMDHTDMLRSEAVEARLATGYTFGPHGPRPVVDRNYVTGAASSVYSSPRDMGRYLAALMGGGVNDHGSVLKPQTLAMMFAPQYQPDPRIPGIGLAFFRVSLGGHRAIEHGGILPGFNSQVFVAPDDHVGVMAFTNGARLAMFWLPEETAKVLSHVLDAPEAGVRTDVPQHPEIWEQLCGWYPFTAPLTDTRARSMLGAGIEVFVKRGQLMVRVMSPIPAAYHGFVLHPDEPADPYVFRIDLAGFGIGTARLIFSREPRIGRTRAHLDLMPISLERRATSYRPRSWAKAAAAGALVAGGALVAVGRARRRSGPARRTG